MSEFKDITGQVFDRLTVIRRVGTRRYRTHNDVIWLCRCCCGVEVQALGYLLRKGSKTSCGCKRKEELGARRRTHGMTGTAAYQSWRDMVARCTYPSHASYPNYGARGVTVDPGWCGPGGFERFMAVVGPYPGPGFTVDRKDPHGNYVPGNCRWLHRKLQNRTRRDNRVLTCNGEMYCLSEWAERIGLSKSTIRGRLTSGWTVEAALTTPRLPPTHTNRPRRG